MGPQPVPAADHQGHQDHRKPDHRHMGQEQKGEEHFLELPQLNHEQVPEETWPGAPRRQRDQGRGNRQQESEKHRDHHRHRALEVVSQLHQPGAEGDDHRRPHRAEPCAQPGQGITEEQQIDRERDPDRFHQGPDHELGGEEIELAVRGRCSAPEPVSRDQPGPEGDGGHPEPHHQCPPQVLDPEPSHTTPKGRALAPQQPPQHHQADRPENRLPGVVPAGVVSTGLQPEPESCERKRERRQDQQRPPQRPPGHRFIHHAKSVPAAGISGSGVGRQQLPRIPALGIRPRVAVFSLQGDVQPGQVVVAGQFDHTETRQVRGQPLHVQQIDAGPGEFRHQPEQRHLGRVAAQFGVVKHGFPREHPSLVHPVESPDQPAVGIPGLDAVHVPGLVEGGVGEGDAVVDPAVGAFRVGAGGQHVGEGVIDGGGVAGRRLAQRPGDAQPARWQHGTSQRRPPPHPLLHGHGEHPAAVGDQRQGGVEFVAVPDQVGVRPGIG